ncbi:MAG: hypothetical protein CEN90_658 [Parcubacteria group bacterium Licking1014_17]|nr:MAG: hypothetical protein CEN90_658 [Parcubacteria group bacterium Licking1014_17]
MKNISVIISFKPILKHLLEVVVKSLEAGNYKKWGLNPILPPRLSDNEDYGVAAERFWNESGWSDRVQPLVPKINDWWNKFGAKFTESLSADLKVIEPEKYYIILTPFGPGGSYNTSQSAIYVRITDPNDNLWWQRVIVHEIAHLVSVKQENKDHARNEDRINKIVREKLEAMGMTELL